MMLLNPYFWCALVMSWVVVAVSVYELSLIHISEPTRPY